MEIDKSFLIESYVEENRGRVDSIFESVTKLKNNPDDEECLKVLLRDLHTLKGTSRMLGFNIIESVSHSVEDVFKAFRDKQITLNDDIFKIIYFTIEKFKLCIDKLEKEGSDDAFETIALTEALSDISTGKNFSYDTFSQGSVPVDDVTSISQIKSMNVNIKSVDSIIGELNTIILRQFKCQYYMNKFQQIAKESNSVYMQNLLREMKSDVTKQKEDMFDLQNSLFNLRMLPLGMVLRSLKQNIEMEALNSGKKVNFNIPESDIAVDKNILESISESLLHIVRNSLSHGIETPEDRLAKGKNETGNISVKVTSQSSKIIIEVSDDGRGIDFEAVREKAMNKFPELASNIKKMDVNDLEQFLYYSGFSTKKQVDAISGRGVGLDVVKSNIDKVKGRISLHTELNKGTTFTLVFPISLATLQGLFIQLNSFKLFLPSNYVHEVQHIKPSSYVTKNNVLMVNLHDELVQVYDITEILGSIRLFDSDQNLINERETYQANEIHSIVILEYLGQKIAIRVNKIFNTDTLISRPLPKIFEYQKVMQGIVFDENFSMIPIINIPKVIQMLMGTYLFSSVISAVSDEFSSANILVVDDSATTLLVEKQILEGAGFNVETAEDGVAALKKIKKKKYDFIITDLRMPNMDGFELVEKIREIEKYNKVPIFVISSLYESEAKDRVIKLGAQEYIMKIDFKRNELVKIIKKYKNGVLQEDLR
ncbi:MAG: response regulator [Treponemataceae bacterium]|nr:response regulator [Treponemataceae bacterium]